ncbi:DUF4238 domain-containing protein [Duganella guangzhouensis]|uniref:DUF4238 domain-containing protein n=1 Tax=Duganella guangzhouensis TaxID=2666084 RepID=UPI0035310644
MPQSVQRAFEAKRTGLKTQVYVYHKDRPPYLTSTEGVGAQRDFYSTPEPHSKDTLDDRITDFELDELNEVLIGLRAIKHGPVDPGKAALIIAHLTVRTAHLRGTLQSLVQSAADQMGAIVDEPESVRKFIGIDSSSDTRLQEEIKSSLSAVGLDSLSQDDRFTIERMIAFRLRERFDVLFENATGAVKTELTAMMGRMPDTIAQTHKRSLSESLVSNVRFQALEKLQWRVVAADTSERCFILPDCVAIGCTNATGDFLPFAMMGFEDITTVVMPLSPRQLLVGGLNEVPQENLNGYFADCSLNFVISSRQGDDVAQHAQRIGHFAAGMNINLPEDGFEPNPEPVLAAHFEAGLHIQVPPDKTGRAVKREILAVVRETVDAPVLSTIESVIVTPDMRATLQSLMQRMPSDLELRTAEAGLALPIRSARWQSRIIITRRMAEALLPNTESDKRRLARRVIRINLGRALYLGCWARQYPAILEHPQPTLWRDMLCKVAFGAASQYAGALASRDGMAPRLLDDEAQDELVSGLRLGLSLLPHVRAAYSVHQDVDQLTRDAAGPLEALLNAVAALAGFAAAEQGTLNDYPKAAIDLAKVGLLDWAILFAKDLARHYEQRAYWSSAADLNQLAEHAERILWTIGVSGIPFGELYKIQVGDEDRVAFVGRILSQ